MTGKWKCKLDFYGVLWRFPHFPWATSQNIAARVSMFFIIAEKFFSKMEHRHYVCFWLRQDLLEEYRDEFKGNKKFWKLTKGWLSLTWKTFEQWFWVLGSWFFWDVMVPVLMHLEEAVKDADPVVVTTSSNVRGGRGKIDGLFLSLPFPPALT